jgi:hypothetical protein
VRNAHAFNSGRTIKQGGAIHRKKRKARSGREGDGYAIDPLARLRGELEGGIGEQLLLELVVDLREHRLGVSAGRGAIAVRRHSVGPGEAEWWEGRTAIALRALSRMGRCP